MSILCSLARLEHYNERYNLKVDGRAKVGGLEPNRTVV